MGEKIRLSISIKLAASFTLFAIVIILAIGYISYTVGFDIRNTVVHESMAEHVSSIKSHMDHLYGEESEDVSRHAADYHLLENTVMLLNNQSADAHAKLKRDLVAYVTFDDEVSALFIMDAANGRVIASTDPLDYDAQLSGESFFIEGKSRSFISVNHYCVIKKTTSSMVSAPMYHNDSVVAVVVMRVDDSELMDDVDELEGLGSTGVAYLIDESGVIINNRSNGTANQIVTSEGIARGFRGESGVLEYTSHNGRSVVGAYEWVPEYNSLILVERDLAEVYAPILEFKKRITTTAVSLLVILFVLIVLITNYLTKPIKALNTGMKNIECGDYSAHIEPMYNDELGDLALSFNEMVEKLQRTMGELESIFTSADAGIMLVDIDMKILRVNDWVLKRFGYVVGNSICESFWDNAGVRFECPVEMALESNAPVIVERVHTEEGLEHTHLVTASPVYNSNGIAIGAVLVLADITERLQMEDELRQYSTKLEKMVEDKTKKLSDKLVEIEKMNDVFVDRELVHIETKEKLSEMLAKYQRLEEQLRQIRSDADG